MSCEFSTVEYEGVLVRCSHRVWSRHIVPRHAELEAQQAAIIDTLNDPDYVYQSGRHPDRRLHYRREVLTYPYEQDFLVVIVSYAAQEAATARVVTAYRKRPGEAGETLIWSGRGAA